MDKYEFNIKVEQIKKLVNKNDFATAMKIADTIDWRRVRNANLLSMISQVYEKNREYQEAKEVLLLAYERAPIGKRLLYKLTELALKEGSVREAEDYYREFCDLAPEDTRQHILRYLILKEKKAPIDQLIKALERYTATELDEKWMYELADLYARAGQTSQCVRLCDKMILLFGVGPYVERAMDLKQRYAPLNGYQRNLAENKEVYEERLRAVEEEYENGIMGGLQGYQEQTRFGTGASVPDQRNAGESYGVQGGSNLPSGYATEGNYGTQGGYGAGGNYGTQGGYRAEESYGTQGGYATEGNYGTQGGYGAGENYGTQGGYSAGNYGAQGGYAPDQPYGFQEGYYGRENYDSQSGYDTEEGYASTPNYGSENAYGIEENQYGPGEGYAQEPIYESAGGAGGRYIERNRVYGSDEDGVYVEEDPGYGSAPQNVDDETMANWHQAEAEQELAAEMSRISQEGYREPDSVSGHTKIFGTKTYVRPMPYIRKQSEEEREKVYHERSYTPHHLMIEARTPEEGFQTAVEILKQIHEENGVNNQVIKISGSKLSRRGVFNVSDKLAGKDLIVEEAGDLAQQDLEELQMLLERDETGMIVVLIDNPYQMEELHHQNPGFVNLFKCINAGEDLTEAAEAGPEELTEEPLSEEVIQGQWEAEEEPPKEETDSEPEEGLLSEKEPEPVDEENNEEEAENRSDDEDGEEEDDSPESDSEEEYREEEYPEDEYEEGYPQDEYEDSGYRDGEYADGEYPDEEYEEDGCEDNLADDEEMDLKDFADYAVDYAREIDCSITGKSMLALYERIEIMEEDGIPLTRTNAEDLIEEAADKAEKPSLGGLIKGVFSSKYDKDGLLILKEEHFI